MEKKYVCLNNVPVFIISQVRSLKGIPVLVQLFSSENQEVQRYATGATRNLIYENMDNKTALIEAGGISKLIGALKELDDELLKNITGILVVIVEIHGKVHSELGITPVKEYNSHIR